MNKKRPQLKISISREHADNQLAIEESFEDFEVNFDAGLMRFSQGDLPMQVIISLVGIFVSGVIWDIFKLSLKKLFKKFPKAQVTIRDNNAIMYSIKADFSINVIVVPDREKEFEHIKKIDDLIKYWELKK